MTTTTLLVTGANGDIGRGVVKDALSMGKTVFATIRNEAHRSSFPENKNLNVLIMHVDDPESIKATFAQMDQILGDKKLNAVIHCAAMESPSTVEFLKLEKLEQIFKINTAGSLAIMQQSFPRLRQSGGNLVLASSLWGRVSGPLVCAYSASKWALESLTDAARRETRGMGFNISLANIGAVKSRMLDAHVKDVQGLLENATTDERELYSHVYKSHADKTVQFNNVAITVDKVAKKLIAIADSRKPSPRYKIGLDAKLVISLDWLIPAGWMDKLLGINKA